MTVGRWGLTVYVDDEIGLNMYLRVLIVRFSIFGLEVVFWVESRDLILEHGQLDTAASSTTPSSYIMTPPPNVAPKIKSYVIQNLFPE